MKRLFAIFVVILLVAVAVPLVASADTTQVWYLNDTSWWSPYGYYMDRESPTAADPSETEDYVRVPAGGYARGWLADEAATVDVGFPSGGTWNGQLWLKSAPPAEADKIKVEVGYWDGSFKSKGSQLFSPDGSQTLFSMSYTGEAFTVTEGNCLAFQVTNYYSATDIDVDTGGGFQSNFISPAADPGYPIPELPTIVLLGTGLMCLVGYLGLKRRKGVVVRA